MKKMYEKVISIILIMMMLVSYFPAIVLAIETKEVTDTDKYIDFNIEWTGKGESIIGETNTSYGFNYNLIFNKVPTGFKDIEIILSNKSGDGKPLATIQANNINGATINNYGAYSSIYFGNQNTGVQYAGNGYVTFANDGTRYDKDIIVTIRGKFTDPSTGETINIDQIEDADLLSKVDNKKVLKANITPKTEITTFYAGLTSQYKSNGVAISEQIERNTVSMGQSQYGGSKGWYATGVIAKYPIHINAYTYTQDIKLQVILDRKCDNESKLRADGYTVNWGGLDTLLGNPSKVENDDGTDTYTFTKGVKSDSFVKENTFKLDNDFTIVVNYDIPNTNPEAGGSLVEKDTNCYITVKGEANGWKIVKEYGNEESITKVTAQLNPYQRVNYTTLFSYTPGTHAWISTDFKTLGSSYISNEQLEDLKTNRKMILSFTDSIKNISGDVDEQNGVISFSSPRLTYLGDDGVIKSINLSGKQMRIVSVIESAASDAISEITIASNTSEFDGEFVIDSAVNETICSVKLKDFLNNYFYGYTLNYELNVDEIGLSDTEIMNIMNISVMAATSGSNWISGGGNAVYNNINSLGYRYSYMELNIGDSFDSGLEQALNTYVTREIKLSMYKNTDVLRTSELSVVNENPIFYIHLPSDFRYKNYDVSMTSGSNSSITILDDEMFVYNDAGESYLVIPCAGTYDSKKMGRVDISIRFSMKAKSSSLSGRFDIEASMITDNGLYYIVNNNNNGFRRLDGTVPDKLHYSQSSFDISGSKLITATTEIGLYGDATNMADTTIAGSNNNPIKTYPMIAENNSNVVFRSVINSVGSTLSNVSIVSRLPIMNNKFIDNNVDIIEVDYGVNGELNSYIDKKGTSLNGISKDTAIPRISMTNLSNIRVLESKGGVSSTESEVAKSNYKIQYSNDENSGLTDGTWIDYVEGTSDVSNAKSIRAVFNDNVRLYSGRKYVLEYEMTMPASAGMAGSTTAVQYKKDGSDDFTKLYSAAGYVINGKRSGDLTVRKQFEGYSIGVAPSGLSIENIQFKLKYYDAASGEWKFVKNAQGQDMVASTDSTGTAKFTDVSYGEYYLSEVTEFDDYFGIGNLVNVNIEPGENVTVIALNKLKKAELIVDKEWENTNDQQGEVTFLVKRISSDTVKYENQGVLNPEIGNAHFYGLPYGEYEVTEVKNVDGWTAVEKKINVSLNKDTVNDQGFVSAKFVNKLAKGTLKIVKTVPPTESVNQVKFHVTGLATVSNLIDKSGNHVDNNYDFTVTIGDDYSNIDNVDVEISEENKKATITLSNLNLGLYTIEEIDIPTINVDGTSIKKYVAAIDRVQLKEDGKIVTSNIENRYKRGKIEINKTAKLKEGNKYTDIGDLSEFSVRVYGTSYYGNEVDTLIQLNENGFGSAYVEIGEYTVKEVEVDGYTTYYGEDNTATTTPPTIKLTDSVVVKQKLYNEHTGVGYVRVEKTLEGITDLQKVIDAGIQFEVIGQNVAGGRVNEVIDINKIDTNKNVAYGISGPISVGGEYVVQEVEETIPDFFEGVEPKEIELKTAHTTENPLIINAVNERSKGDLEIITETVPVGGPLNDIIYKVTEVNVNKDGSYEKIGDSKEIAGSNDPVNISQVRLDSVNAGYYLVEHVKVPDGWTKDVPQIVEVPKSSIGYATLEITQNKKINNNKVYINKILLNTNGDIITDEELEAAKLYKKESFEVKLRNIETGEEFYVFTSVENPGVIEGLEVGMYEIEELYKPKYITEGIYLDRLTEADDNNVIYRIPEEMTEIEGKKVFEITEVDGKIKDVYITIKNTINTSFGFGGQSPRNNLSKVVVDEEQVEKVTKAVVYVVDENNNAIAGCKGKLYDGNGNAVLVTGGFTEFDIKSKKLVFKGLNPGKYNFVITEVPAGYLIPENKEVIVYKDAVQVVKTEVQKNIPRGSLMLSTTIKNDDNETKYVARSKYKIVSKESGEVLKFIRTATGDYKKTNLDIGSETISLKAGPVEVIGIEVGDYEVGIVDITKGYGIIDTNAKDVTVVENTLQNANTEVESKKIVDIEAGYSSSFVLDADGDVYSWGSYYNYTLGDNVQNYNKRKINFGEGVKIKKINVSNQAAMAIDLEGNVWVWGYNNSGDLGNTSIGGYIYNPIRLTSNDFESDYYNDGLKFKDIYASHASYSSLLVDEFGRLWAVSKNYYDKYGFICLSEQEGTELNSAYKQGIVVDKLADINSADNLYGFIDSVGNIWMWGKYKNKYMYGSESYYEASLTPINISKLNNFQDVQFKELSINYTYDSLAIDNNGNLWIWGSSDLFKGLVGNTDCEMTKINLSLFDNRKLKNVSIQYNSAMVIDESGKIWSWGSSEIRGDSDLINNANEDPVCISEIVTNPLYQKSIKKLTYGHCYSSSEYMLALDDEGSLWAWGNNGYGESGLLSYNDPNKNNPKIMSNIDYNECLAYNFKFKNVFASYECSFAIDENNNLWAWGYNNYSIFGVDYSIVHEFKTPQRIYLPNNMKVIKIALQNYARSSLILTDDGHVFLNGSGYDGNGNNYSKAIMVDITSSFNLESDEKIIDVYVGSDYSDFYAVDSNGKVYAWGTKSAIGTNDSSADYSRIKNMSDTFDCLKDVKIKSITANDGLVFAISEDGKVYTWGSSSKMIEPSCLLDTESKIKESYENGTRFIKSAKHSILDNKGGIWSWSSYAGWIYSKENTSSGLYNYYQIDEDFKVIDIFDGINYSGSGDVVKDSNNNLWYSQGSGNYWYYNIDTMDYLPDNIVTISRHLGLDSDGKIWFIPGNSGANNSDYEAGVGHNNYINKPICIHNEDSFKINNQLVNKPINNKLNGVKIKNLASNQLVVDENDKVYYFNEKNKIVDLSTSEYEGYENPLYGKKVERFLFNNSSKVVITSDNEVWDCYGKIPRYVFNMPDFEYKIISTYSSTGSKYGYIVADNEGKVWACSNYNFGLQLGTAYQNGTNGKIVCLNNTEGNPIYEATQKHSDFRIILPSDDKKIDRYYLDNYGKLWSFGNNLGCGDNNIYPICISDIENTDLANAYKEDSQFKIKEIISETPYYYHLIDSNNNMWIADACQWEREDSRKNNLFRLVSTIADSDLAMAFNENSDFNVVQYKNDQACTFVGNDGYIYYISYGIKTFTKIEQIHNVKSVEVGETIHRTIYENRSQIWTYTINIYAFTEDGIYKVVLNDKRYASSGIPISSTYTCTKIYSAKAKKIINYNFNSIFVLDEDGKLYAFGGTGINNRYESILTQESQSILNGKTVVELNVYKDIVYAIDSENNVYRWTTNEYAIRATCLSDVCRQYEDKFGTFDKDKVINIIKANCDNIIMRSNDNKIYTLRDMKTFEVCSFEDELYGGIGRIVNVVGSKYIQTENGKIYNIVENYNGTITLSNVESVPENDVIEQDEDLVEIPGANIVKKLKYKALDSNGNLYVWDSYTGIYEEMIGPINLTETEYSVKPIVIRGNGWTIIKNNYE